MFKESNKDIILALAAFFQFVVLMLQQLLLGLELVSYESFRYISISLSAIPMIPAFIVIIQRRMVFLLLTYLLALFIIIITLAFSPSNEQYISSEVFYLLTINIPAFLCLASIKDLSVITIVIHYLSLIIVLIGVIYFVFMWSGEIHYDHYNMPFGYYLLLPALFFLLKRNTISNILFAITVSMMMIIGSRGPLLTVIVFSILLFVLELKKWNGLIWSFGIIIILFVVFWPSILELTYDLGINSRSIGLLQEGGFLQSGDRIKLYTEVWQNILDHPWLGLGIYGDRTILDGLYSHNLILEMLNNFGILLGTCFILLMAVKFVKFITLTESPDRQLILMLFCFGIVPLMFSRSYLNDPGFGIFIGSLFSISKKLQSNLH